jgi:hypothetical protein
MISLDESNLGIIVVGWGSYLRLRAVVCFFMSSWLTIMFSVAAVLTVEVFQVIAKSLRGGPQRDADDVLVHFAS